MSGLLQLLGRTCARRHRFVIALWVVAAVGIVLLAKASGGRTFDNFRIPNAESQTAADLLVSRFPQQSGTSATVVFQAKSRTLGEPAAQSAIDTTLTALRKLPHTTQVVGPVGPLASTLTSKDGTIGLASVQYDVQPPALGTAGFRALEAATAPATSAGLDVQFGGPLVDYANVDHTDPGDAVGLLISVFILLIAFGSFVAAGLPIGTALFGLAVGISGITLLAAVTDVGTVAPDLGTMIGLGVGIDYSLFIVTRHRENLRDGMPIDESVGHAVATAGQAVIFAGTTVVIAICGLALSGIPYVAVLGYAAALVVAVMMLAAITLLPALLGLVGHRVDSLRIRGLHLGRHRAATTDSAGRPTFWARFATAVARHRWPCAIGAIAVLLTLAAPFLSIRYGQPDDGTAPSDTTQHQAFELLAKGFGPGVNGPLAVVVTFPKGGQVPQGLLTSLRSAPGVASVAPPRTNPAGNTAVVTVIPTSAPDAQATTDLVASLRDDVVPAAVKGTPARAYVGGVTAAYIDLGNRIKDRLPLFVGAVVLLSFLLLMMVFHSIVVPLTAAVMNLLSVGAAYGVTVAVFQWGWAKGLIGLESTVPIVSFVPMMMFAVLFGLSMDYQVFLLTRVREEYAACHETRRAVVTGVATTARVITSAALIMISVFLSFVANPVAELKMFGLGLAVAVAVDATVVRMVLVPALMEILGRANWWFPKSLARFVPKIDLA
ncbi:MAG TPA: MMPL family transporter [Acidimicrobiia bacterium]|nr:MMPL family transporter [Acidimicrobiia bacterium]